METAEFTARRSLDLPNTRWKTDPWPTRLSGRHEPGDRRGTAAAEQIEAVLAHELCHARYRDHVSISVDMIVALFWFLSSRVVVRASAHIRWHVARLD
jgi:hypothetical protein